MAGAGSQHHPPGVAGGAAAGAGTVSPTAAGPGEDSSDSEAEQEGPQKLIRKVSTSGQIRTKCSCGLESPLRCGAVAPFTGADNEMV
ncbi:Diacylglycerol kinase eta [Microtus ochrogaster]|uniref:Diacylglycerol kinase eta n=1 Tax=Microtus ochrogaster TaxID=79684 RepID=A0A8J6G444_MICOH|nr:Diacylglycerol kinase eta [Microtus ochrogaster]